MYCLRKQDQNCKKTEMAAKSSSIPLLPSSGHMNIATDSGFTTILVQKLQKTGDKKQVLCKPRLDEIQPAFYACHCLCLQPIIVL